MKEIYFVRHAKSSWSKPMLADIDRPLNHRGKRDAPIMAQKLSEIVPRVDTIFSSPAKRARKTAKHFRNAIPHRDFVIMNEIYHAWPDTLIDIVRNIEESVNKALIFGHNPGFTSVYNYFSSELLHNLPTCGIFGLQCLSSWQDMDTTNTSVNVLLFPKMFFN